MISIQDITKWRNWIYNLKDGRLQDEDKDESKKDRQYLMYGLALICIMVIIIGTYQLIQVKVCTNKGGFHMEDKSCYIPKDEQERQEIIERGYVKTGWSVDDIIGNWSSGLE